MAKLPKFEDWTPPWGDDFTKADAEKVAKLVYNARVAEQTAKDAKKESDTRITALESERDEALEKLEDAGSKDLTPIQKLEREIERLKNPKVTPAAAPKADEAGNLQAARLEIALDKGLTKAQALRLHGDTREELEADADAYIEEHGLKSGDGDDGDEPNADGVSNRPQGHLRNSFTDGNDDKDLDVDPAKLELAPRRW